MPLNTRDPIDIGPDAVTPPTGEVLRDTGLSLRRASGIVASDGSRAKSWRVKLAQLKASETVVAKAIFLGHSWFDRNAIPQAIIDRFVDDGFALSANGWISLGSTGSVAGAGSICQLRDAVLDYNADWTLNDGGAGTGVNCFDNYLLTTSTDTATLSLTNYYGTSIYVYIRNKGGSFRWRIDGGSWTTHTGTTGNAYATPVAVTGLANTTHTLEIDTTVNTGLGQVWIEAIRTESPGVGGIEFSKSANGGTTSNNWTNPSTLSGMAYYMALNPPDLVFLMLSTNDQRLIATDPAEFKTNIQSILTTLRTASPNCCILLVGDPQNNAGGFGGNIPGGYPMEEYNDGLSDIYFSTTYTEIVRLDLICGTYAEESGIFIDQYHRTYGGAQRDASEIYKVAKLA